MKPNNENIKFTISQLRQDKIIMAVEAVAVNTACLLGSFLAGYFPVPPVIPIVIIVIGIIYTLYALIGNLFRLNKIKTLEKQL